MANENENEPAKLLLPYLQRADELQKHDPLVAYYCRLYAMERGLKIPQSERTKTTSSILISLMKQLEKDKKSLQLGPDDHLHLEGFASNVFAKADKQDRAGRADLNTAKTFYAASIFFEIINQFGDLPPDLEQKQKYAAWKAADIRKALKEGRKPVPGPPGGEDLSVPPSTTSGDYDLESRPKESDFAAARQADYPLPPSTDSSIRHASNTDFPPSPRNDPIIRHASETDFAPPPRNDPAIRSSFESDFPPPPRNDPAIRPSFEPDFPSPPRNDPAIRPSFESDFPPPPRNDPAIRPSFESDSPPQMYDKTNFQNSANFPPSSPSDFAPLSTYPSNEYPSHDFHQPPPTSGSENSYSHLYHQQHYQPESQPHLPQHYPLHDASSFPNFQSYPSFTESSLPAAPSHSPSHHQGSDTSYSNPSYSTSSPHNVAKYSSSSTQYDSNARNVNVPEAPPTSAQPFHYDCNYLPPPEKIAEAHKAARFAVGALAFDEVSVAVEHLKKSLELLTNPSAGN